MVEVLVDLEEVLDLVAQAGRDVVDVAEPAPARVVERDADHLLVGALLVGHVEDADRPHADAAAREGRVADEHERVERVAVLGERSLDVAVVGRVAHRGEQAAVEDDPAQLVVPLVLVARAARNPRESCSGGVSGSLRDLDEERLERELRRQVELLEPAPRLAHCLGGPLGAEEPLAGRVLAELVELVEVDRRPLGADRDGDEVAVPGRELLELGEQLLALRAARRALHALLGLARGQLEPGDARLLGLARLGGTRLRVREHDAAASEASNIGSR